MDSLETTILNLVTRKAELEANLAALMAQDKILFAQLGALQVENSVLQARVGELECRLEQADAIIAADDRMLAEWKPTDAESAEWIRIIKM